MSTQPLLIASQGQSASPASYTVPGSQEIGLRSVSATFDGSAAGGDFLACLSIYAQSGELLSRTFPISGAIVAGASAEVTYLPFPPSTTSSSPAGITPGIYKAQALGAPGTLASGAAGTWVQLGGFATADNNVATRIAISGGNLWTITDLHGNYSVWQVTVGVRFHPSSGAGAAGTVGVALGLGTTGNVLARQEVAVPAGYTPFFGVVVTCPLVTSSLVSSSNRMTVMAYQNTGINYAYTASDVPGFGAVFLNEF